MSREKNLINSFVDYFLTQRREDTKKAFELMWKPSSSYMPQGSQWLSGDVLTTPLYSGNQDDLSLCQDMFSCAL